MAPRLQLQALLEELLGSRNVYFQPPATLQMNYPAIVYSRDYAQSEFADNNPYLVSTRYMATYIDRDPDSKVPSKIAALPKCVFSRHYKADNLNHDVYNIYF